MLAQFSSGKVRLLQFISLYVSFGHVRPGYVRLSG
jgi:hypothetical protein